MILNIEIEIELNIYELKMLRKYFENDLSRKLNPFFSEVFKGKKIVESIQNEMDIVSSLYKKDILKTDSINNYELTLLGKSIVDKINRNNIIDKLIKD